MADEERLVVSPSQWAQSILTLDGKSFSLKGREYIINVYDNGYRNILLCTGRQVEKSTTLAALILALATAINGFEIIYGAPDDNKVRTFSHQKLGPFIDFSPFVVKHYLTGRGVLNNVYERKFSNGSSILLRNGTNGGANFRAPSGDLVALDEIQDMDSEAIPVAREMISHSDYKMFFNTGTPKTLNNPIEALWKESTQTEWLIPCPRCGGAAVGGGVKGSLHYWNNIGIPNIAPYGLICARCGGIIKPHDGMWVEMNPSARVKGFRISQPMTEWSDMEEIYYDKLKKYPIAQFMNEVLGISYDSASVAIPQADLMALCSTSRGGGHPIFDLPDKYMRQRPIFAGIDWGVNKHGGGATVLMIGYAERPDRIKIIYAKKLTETTTLPEQAEFIARKLADFGVTMVCADWGASGGRNTIVASYIGSDRIFQIEYVGSTSFINKVRAEVDILRVSRTLAVSDLIHDLITEGVFAFPDWKFFQPFGEDMLNEFIEEDKIGNLKYNHPLNTQDDALHALVYLNLARKLYYEIPLLRLVPTTMPNTESAKNQFPEL